MRIAIKGMGYVGIPTAVILAKLGNDVTGIDSNRERIFSLANNEVPMFEPGLEELLKQYGNRITFTADNSALNEADVVYIAVGTPSKDNGSVDMQFIYSVAKEIGDGIMKDNVVIVDKSTVPVGTTEAVTEIIRERLNQRNLSINFEVVSNPEFLKQGDAMHDSLFPDRVVLGYKNEWARKTMLPLFNGGNVIFTDTKSAEMIKYASNTALALDISIVNALVQLFPHHDIWQVSRELKKINPQAFVNPGLGYGGSCFPKDVKEFAAFFRANGLYSSLIESIEEVNKIQKGLAVSVLKEMIGNIEGKEVGLLGLAFKANTDDIREASSINITKNLIEKGANIRCYDPKAMNHFLKIFPNIEYCSNFRNVLDAEIIMLLTDWEEFHAVESGDLKNKIVIDGRNFFTEEKFKLTSGAYRLGKGSNQFSTLEIERICNRYMDVHDAYGAQLIKIAEFVGANAPDVFEGMMLDKRIGKSYFNNPESVRFKNCSLYDILKI